MTPEGLLCLAQRLAQCSTVADPSEAEHLRRTAINRAYYAAYTAARRHLFDVEGYIFSTREPSHKQVRDKFKSSDSLRKRVFDLLLELTDLRCRADYEDDDPPSELEMNAALVQSREVLQKGGAIGARKPKTRR